MINYQPFLLQWYKYRPWAEGLEILNMMAQAGTNILSKHATMLVRDAVWEAPIPSAPSCRPRKVSDQKLVACIDRLLSIIHCLIITRSEISESHVGKLISTVLKVPLHYRTGTSDTPSPDWHQLNQRLDAALSSLIEALKVRKTD